MTIIKYAKFKRFRDRNLPHYFHMKNSNSRKFKSTVDVGKHANVLSSLKTFVTIMIRGGLYFGILFKYLKKIVN